MSRDDIVVVELPRHWAESVASKPAGTLSHRDATQKCPTQAGESRLKPIEDHASGHAAGFRSACTCHSRLLQHWRADFANSLKDEAASLPTILLMFRLE